MTEGADDYDRRRKPVPATLQERLARSQEVIERSLFLIQEA